MLHRLSTAGSIAVLLLAGSLPASAWGGTGHHVVGQIAENHLTPQAAQAVRQLLGADSLAEVGNWADEVRSTDAWRHTATWHYVNFGPGEQDYEATTKNPAGDAVAALRSNEVTLRDQASSRRQKIAALKFLVHLVGDIHQPLHAARADDRGGNLTEVRLADEQEPTNLHRVWDNYLVDRENRSFTEWVRLLGHPDEAEVREWQASGYADWANESRRIAERCYEFEEGEPLGNAYFEAQQPLVRQLLLEAGVRLAGKLNSIFADAR